MKISLMGIDIRSIQVPTVSARKEQQRNVFSSLHTLLNREIKFGRRHLKDAKKERFYSELTILLSAGVDIKSALDIIIEEQKQEQDRKLFQQTRESLITGNSFSEGLRESGKFSAYEYFSIKIGEESGNIQSVLKELTRYYTNRIKQRRQLTSALTYPALVLFVAVVAVAFMLNYIVPMFGEIFKRFGGELPALTKMVIHASTFFRSYSYWMVLFLAGLVFIFLQIRWREWYRRITSQFLLKIPVIGHMVNTVYLARFCQSMALLTTSRTPMLRS
ncbi:MAG TPA: type II secretion system F family protein, partial [Bacteroidales bacterium]|nr:type II secretion system F family protein [Bacteroidales bacterium]